MFAKRLLYLNDQQLTAYIYESGQIVQQALFFDNATGHEEFSALLKDRPNLPIYFLTDLAEEDYRQETIPHVLGRDRAALLKRKLNQFYRATPLRHSILQGRETEGRRDDKVLVTALTNADNLKPWLGLIREHGAALAGIYSAALVTRLLVRKMGFDGDHQLILTQQQGGLRQSYFQRKDIKFSRLTQLTDLHSDALAKAVLQESTRAQQYLNSLRLLPRDTELKILVISHGENLQVMKSVVKNSTFLQYQFIDIAEIAQKIGIRNLPDDTYCDHLFLHLLGRYPPANQYAPNDYLKIFKLRQLRLAMQATSAVLLMVGLTLTVQYLWQAIGYMQQSRQIQASIVTSQKQYLEISKNFPATPISADNIKTIVATADLVAENNLPNRRLLTEISQAWDGLPKKIQLQKLRWLYSTDPQSIKGDTATSGGTPSSPTAASPQNGVKPSLVAVLNGEIDASNYGEAVTWLNVLATALQKTGAEVTTLKLPLDTRPQSSLQGSTDDNTGKLKASFQLKMIWKPQP